MWKYLNYKFNKKCPTLPNWYDQNLVPGDGDQEWKSESDKVKVKDG